MTGWGATTPGSLFVSEERNGRARSRSSKSVGAVSSTKGEGVGTQEQGFVQCTGQQLAKRCYFHYGLNCNTHHSRSVFYLFILILCE